MKTSLIITLQNNIRCFTLSKEIKKINNSTNKEKEFQIKNIQLKRTIKYTKGRLKNELMKITAINQVKIIKTEENNLIVHKN